MTSMGPTMRIRGLTGGGPDGWGIYRKARRIKAAGTDVVELTVGGTRL